MNTLTVKSVPGILVPMEDKPRSYITDTEPVDVPDSSYYQRRISDGDLEVVIPDPVIDPAPANKKATSSKTIVE